MAVPTEAGLVALESFRAVLSEEENATAQLLVNLGQAHVFAGWSAGDADLAAKQAFFATAKQCGDSLPGGFEAYIGRGKVLLESARLGANPYDGYVVEEPKDAVRLENMADFEKYEEVGMGAAKDTSFVIVAGGLGERLGYRGIKLALPTEISTGKCYIQMYIEHILAMQARARAAHNDDTITLELGIMTSADTDALTRQLLEANQNFGMTADQLTLFKQGFVPSLLDNEAHFAMDSTYEQSLKPHGHGDVHMLLWFHETQLVKKWNKLGKKWICFFQDTNGQVFRSLPAALGVSVEKNLDVNSITVPRMQGDAVGAICTLTRPVLEDESKADLPSNLTINVEYNQLTGLLGDGAEPVTADGCSVYPGNINVLVFGMESYYKVLEAKQGVITEFVNPKYSNKEKTVFKKPTRLECMMQDYPKLLPADARVGFSQFQRWTSFSAVKNQIADGIAKQASGNDAECGATGEEHAYGWYRRVLGEAGVAIEQGAATMYRGITVTEGAHIVCSPSFGTTQAEIRGKFVPGKSTVTAKSTLLLEGSGIKVAGLELDGTLVVKAVAGANVTIDGLTINNAGWKFEEVKEADDAQIDQKYAVRGYTLSKEAGAIFEFNEAGDYVLSNDTAEQYAK